MEHHSGQWIEGISQLQLGEEASLRLLIAQYFQLVEPQNLQILPGPSLKKPAVQAAIYEHMFNEVVLWPIPPATYRTRVLKMIISRIEESFSDPEEDVCTSEPPYPPPSSICLLRSFILIMQRELTSVCPCLLHA
jgi:hypothetical protein